jgi:hypothetical protein
LNTAVYITVNLLLFFAWYVSLFRYRTVISFADRISGTFVLGLTQIIATEMLLGAALKQLYAAPLFFLNVFISAAVLIFASLSGRRRQPAYPDVNNIEKVPGNAGKEIKNLTGWFIKEARNDIVLLVISVLFLISVGWIIVLGYLFPSYTWDALWYHLPIVGYIMQDGAIHEFPVSSFIDQFINIFPKNIELFFLWNVIFLKSDVITDLSQLLFAAVSVLSIYGISVKLKIDKRKAIYASLLFFFTPIIILQSSTNYVDVAVTALFLIAINFLMYDMPPGGGAEIRLREGEAGPGYLQKRDIMTVMAGLATGLLLGAKGSGPLFAGILSAVVIIRECIWRFRSSAKGRKKSLIRIALKSFTFYLVFFFVPVFLIGGYWYIKNWFVYGNPVHPMEISFMNITIFRGLYQGIIEPAPAIINKLHPVTRPLYVWLEKVEFYLYDSRLGGLGPIWFILFLPSTAFTIVYSAIKKNYKFMALFMILTGAFLMHPRNWNPRYVIFIVGLGALSFGLVFDHFRKRSGILRIIALLLAGYTFLVSNSPCVTPKQIKKFFRLPPLERTLMNQAPFNIDLNARQDYGYWTWIHRNVRAGETLAYTFEPMFVSPLWNGAYTSRISYVKSGSYQEWLKVLREKEATYVLMRKDSEEDKWVGRERKIFSAVGWLTGQKEKFSIVYADDNYVIAKVMEHEG